MYLPTSFWLSPIKKLLNMRNSTNFDFDTTVDTNWKSVDIKFAKNKFTINMDGLKKPIESRDLWKILNKKQKKNMKQGIHPDNYRPVVFKDMSNGDMFLSRSTAKSNETIEFEGETYPVIKLEISNTSHPFYTGKSKLVDTAGRVDKFMSRYARTKK